MAPYIHTIVWGTASEDQYTMEASTGGFYDVSVDESLQIGDSVKLDSETLSYMGKASTDSTRHDSIGTVREVIDEDYVFVEMLGRIQKIWNPNEISVVSGDVVEIGAAGCVIDKHPDLDISRSRAERDGDVELSSFKEGGTDEVGENEENESLSFDDFGGMTTAQSQFRERVELFLKKPEKIDDIGTEPRMGALFYGPPGTGKSHFARILSDTLDAQFYRVRGPEIVSKGVGDTEELIREIFADAEKENPAIRHC